MKGSDSANIAEHWCLQISGNGLPTRRIPTARSIPTVAICKHLREAEESLGNRGADGDQ
jgi:hypothetical protein